MVGKMCYVRHHGSRQLYLPPSPSRRLSLLVVSLPLLLLCAGDYVTDGDYPHE